MHSQPVPPPAASPTGAPLLPPRVALWLGAVVATALASLGALVAIYPDVRALQAALAVVTAVAGVLGIASPGLRRAAVVLLAVGLVATTGCLHTRASLVPDLRACAAGFAGAELAAVAPDVALALQGEAADWQAQLDGVIARGGQAAWCALLALVQGLEAGTGGSAGAGAEVLEPAQGGLPRPVLLLRGYAYLEAHRD